MSTALPPISATVTSASLSYGIAIAISILVLISTIMLASYICVRIKSHGNNNNHNSFHLDTENNNNTGQSQPIQVTMGLEKPMIEAYPKIVLGESRRLPKPNEGPCAICLSEYLPKDIIRCVLDCNHCFHAACVDQWLKINATCPLCRNSPAPSPLPSPFPTPLSEVVPLAFHAR